MDIETTGYDPSFDSIIEVGILGINSNYEITETFHELYASRRKIPQFITNLTGLKEEDLKDKKFLEDKKLDICNFLKDCTSLYCYGNLEKTFFTKKYNLSFEFVNVLPLVKKGFCISSYKLKDVCEYLGIEIKGVHRAVADAKLLLEVVKILKV